MAAFIEVGSVLQRFGSPANGRCPPELAEICHRGFRCHVGKTNSREKARGFHTVPRFSDLASEPESCGPRRAHPQACGKVRQRNLRHGMVLQSKANLENWIISR